MQTSNIKTEYKGILLEYQHESLHTHKNVVLQEVVVAFNELPTL